MKKSFSYLENLSDLMAGLAIFFLLLFIITILSQRTKNYETQDLNQAVQDLVADQTHLIGEIKKFVDIENENTFMPWHCVKNLDKETFEKLLPKSLEDINDEYNKKNESLANINDEDNEKNKSIGIYFKSENLFDSGKEELNISDDERAALSCVIREFMIRIVLQNKDIIERVFMEGQGDFDFGQGHLDEWKLGNKKYFLTSLSERETRITLGRSREIFALFFNPLNEDIFTDDQWIYFNKSVVGGGLGWSQHLAKLAKKDGFVPTEDDSFRSFQIRIHLKQIDEVLKNARKMQEKKKEQSNNNV